MKIYGETVTLDMREAHGKILELALNGTGRRSRGLEIWWAL